MNYKKRIIRTGKWVALTVAAFLLLGGILFGLAQTGPGRDRIARLITSALNEGGKTRVSMGRLGGLIPFHLKLDRLALSDNLGQWMTLDDLVIRWSPRALLKGQLRVREIRARLLELHRLPPGEDGGGKRPVEASAWPAAFGRLHLERFAIGEVRLGKAVLGEPALLTIEGRVVPSSSGDGLAASLALERRDGPGTRAVINAVLKNRGPELALDLEFEEASGGLAAAALGIRGPLSLVLHGEGPLKAWKGEFRVDGGELGEIRSRVALEVAEDLKMTAGGTLVTRGAALPEEWRRLLVPEARFDLDLRRLKDGTLMMGPSSIGTKDLALEMGGTLDPGTNHSRGRFKLHCRDISPLGSPAGFELGGEARVEGRFSGPMPRPRVTLDAELRRAVADRLRLDALLARIELDWLEGPGPSSAGVRIEGRGEVRGLSLRDSPPLPETDLKWELAAEGTLKDIIHIRRLEAAGERISAGFTGRLDTKRRSGEMSGALEIKDLRPFAAFSGFDLAGSTRLKAELRGDGKDGFLSARIKGTYGIPEGMEPSLKTLLEKGVDYAGSIEVSGTKGLRLSEMELATAAGSLRGDAFLDLENKDLEGSWRMELPRLDAFSPFLKQDVKGSLEGQGRVEGPLDMMSLAAEVRGRDLAVQGIPLEGLMVNLEARGLMPRSEGRLLVEIAPAGDRVKARTDFILEGDRLSLSPLSLKGPGSEIKGNLDMDLRAFLVEGELKGETKDLSAFSALLGEEIGGSIQVETRLKIDEGRQRAIFTAEARHLKGPFGQAGKAGVRGEIGDLFRAPRGTATLDVTDVRRDDLVLDTLVLSAEGGRDRIGFSGSAKGRYREGFEMNISGLLTMSPGAGALQLEGFEARYGDLPLTLARPNAIRGSAEGLRFEGLAFNLGPGTLEGSGTVGGSGFDLDLKLGAIPLGIARLAGAPDLAGRLTGEVHLAGSPARPEGRVRIHIEGLKLRDPLFQDIPPLTVEGRAGLGRGRLQSEFVLKGLTAGPFEAKMDVPLSVSFSPPAWSLEPRGEMKGSLKGDMDLKRMASIAGLDDQTLEGKMEVDLALEGTVEVPVIRGGARVIKGAYENNRSGTVLKDIEWEIAAGTPRLQIVHAGASDGGPGRISAQGWLDVLPSQGFPFRVDLFLDQATLLRNDDATATLGGQLLVSGSIEKALLGGRINLETAEIRIPERLPPEIVDLDVIETGGTKDEELPGRTRPGREWPTELDLTLKSPGRAFVRGRGLDSEWQGEIRVKGEVKAPVVTGALSVVRGSFDFLGKRFELKRGLLSLDGLAPPSPRLDVLAEASGKDMISYLQLSGPVKSPEMKLSSDPPLPSDEILARLLFGRTVSHITPVQALQLAHAVKVLAGGGIDFMGRTRRWLGVDQLEVEQAEGGVGGGTIRAGKYLRENVYLEVERGIGAEGSKASVEWEVTPNVTVETDAGADAEGGVGVRWEWDY
jgi:translocation and assembly module TamB